MSEKCILWTGNKEVWDSTTKTDFEWFDGEGSNLWNSAYCIRLAKHVVKTRIKYFQWTEGNSFFTKLLRILLSFLSSFELKNNLIFSHSTTYEAFWRWRIFTELLSAPLVWNCTCEYFKSQTKRPYSNLCTYHIILSIHTTVTLYL